MSSSAHVLYANNVRCGRMSQADEVVAVDGELATILTHSRFTEDFTFQPPGGPSESCGVKPKVSVTTEFLDVEMSVSDLCLSTRGQCVRGISFKCVTHPESPTVLTVHIRCTQACVHQDACCKFLHTHTHTRIPTQTYIRTHPHAQGQAAVLES